jgi:glycosylphosphatidylinositol transamidase (GPIT) subunit GPI8
MQKYHQMNYTRLFPLLFMLLFGSTVVGQNSHQYNWTIKLDIARFFYHYRSSELTLERRVSPRLGLVIDVNSYLKMAGSKYQNILSADKIKATSTTDFRVSF